MDLAFRMLGDIDQAEDVVQHAFSRLMQADLGEIEDERGWLIVVTSRLCLDQIKSARSRRERVHDAAEIEYVAPAGVRDRGGLISANSSYAGHVLPALLVLGVGVGSFFVPLAGTAMAVSPTATRASRPAPTTCSSRSAGPSASLR